MLSNAHITYIVIGMVWGGMLVNITQAVKNKSFEKCKKTVTHCYTVNKNILYVCVWVRMSQKCVKKNS